MAEYIKAGDQEWKAQEFTQREMGPDGKMKPNPGWKPSEAYRDGYDRIFGKKETTEGDGNG